MKGPPSRRLTSLHAENLQSRDINQRVQIRLANIYIYIS